MRGVSEVRKNGNFIYKEKRYGHNSYVVFKKAKSKYGHKFEQSCNGPWDYLANARKDADGEM